MGITHVKGRKVVVKHSSEALFLLFSDLTNFSKNLPLDVREKTDVKSTPDTLLVMVMGFQIGIKVDERTPFSTIKYVQFGKSPIDFSIFVYLNSVNSVNSVNDNHPVNNYQVANDSCSEFHLELIAELHGIFKLMSGKLQEVVDKVTDEIVRGIGGEVTN